MQAAWLFNYSGKPWLTQKWVREIQDRYYGSDPYNAWLGDEDEGQMGAWFFHSELVKGGKLTLKMGEKPNMKWGSAPEDMPPSMSDTDQLEP